MRERQCLVISRENGGACTTEILPDADWDQRARELKASVPDIGAIEARLFAVRCDGCGRAAELDFDDPHLPGGWASGEDGEFCPACARGESNDRR
jgi:hypothetical protein